jgi:hypothetical protein
MVGLLVFSLLLAGTVANLTWGGTPNTGRLVAILAVVLVAVAIVAGMARFNARRVR